MKTNHIMLTALFITSAALLTPVLHAQQEACSTETAAGTYVVSCSGFTAAGPGGTLLPVHQLGLATGDRDGNFTGSTTVNIGGLILIPDAKVSGKATINPNCTGNITYNKGTPALLTVTFVVLREAKEIHGLVTDTGSVISCVLNRTSK